MLYNRKDVPELNYLKHRHDDFDQFVDYEKTILNSSLSPYMYENDLFDFETACGINCSIEF